VAGIDFDELREPGNYLIPDTSALDHPAASTGNMPSSWTAYQTIEKRSFAWIAKSLGFFDPSCAVGSERMFAHKALAELALLIACRVRLDSSPLDANEASILDHVQRMASWPPYRSAVARNHRSLLLYAWTYAALKICGRNDPFLEHVVKQAIDARYPLVLERIPYRQLDILHFLHVSGISHDGPSPEDVFPFTLLARRPNVIELRESDVYAISHTIFYMTDFGLRSTAWAETFDIAEAVESVEALMCYFQMRGNADLVGELIASSICLHINYSPRIEQAWKFLLSRQAPDGSICGPSGIIDEAAAEAVGGAAYRQWKISYHTTMVAALAALMARQAHARGSYPAKTSLKTGRASHKRDHLVAGCRSAFDSAVRWLSSLLNSSDLPLAVRAAAGLAIGLHVTGLSRTSQDGLWSLACRIDSLPEGSMDWVSLGADTVLLLAYIFQQSGFTCHLLDMEVARLTDALAGVSLREEPEIFSACAFLAKLQRLDRAVIEELAGWRPMFRATAEEGETPAAFSARLMRLSGGDSARLHWPLEERQRTVDWLSFELVNALREYRLGDAAAILRILLLADPGDRKRLVCDAVEYLVSQQRPDGAFGYVADDSKQDACVSIHLDWTLAALWALADFGFAARSVTVLFR